jgi:flavodoxin-like protein
MRTLVLYESMYGNTHAIAKAIAEGAHASGDVTVVPAHEATPELLAWADLLFVGGPTHAHGLSTEASRRDAVAAMAKPDGWSEISLDASAEGSGVREWLDALGDAKGKCAIAFDTKAFGPSFLTGRAASAIDKGLRAHGFRVVGKPASFTIDMHQRLRFAEVDRARKWGARIASSVEQD